MRIQDAGIQSNPGGSILTLAGAPMRRGAALWIESIFGLVIPDVVNRTIQGMELLLLDNGGLLLATLATPIATVISSISGISLLFPQVPVITFEDALSWSAAFGSTATFQPWKLRLLVNMLAPGTAQVSWGAKYWFIDGIDDG